MRPALLLATAGCLLTHLGAAGAAPLATIPHSPGDGAAITVLRHPGGLTLTLDALELTWQEQEDGSRAPLIPGEGELGLTGGPRLPVIQRLIAVPAGMDLGLGEVRVEWEEAGAHLLAHDSGPDGDARRSDEAFAAAARLGGEPVVVGTTGRWRDLRIAPVTLRPVRVSPDGRRVQVARRFEVELVYTPSSGQDGYDPPGVSEALLPLYTSLVVGADMILDGQEALRGSYLIITPQQWTSMIEGLVEWRTRTGYNVIVATTDETGTSTTDLHDYIEDVYENIDPPLDYVLLVGDIDNPANISTYYIDPGVPNPYDPLIATDQKYTYDLAAGNSYANVLPRYFIGRFSADTNTDVLTMVNKTVQYESTPLVGDVQRFRRALVIANEGWAISTRLTQMWVRHKLLENGYTQVYESYMTWDYDPGPGSISQPINQGLSWVSYRGFGSHDSWSGPYFDSGLVASLTNEDNLPVITSMVCGGGAFDELDSDPCFGEVWVRMGSPNNLKGAVAFIGPSEIDTHTRWNNLLDGAWYEGLFDEGLRTTGQLLLFSKMRLYRNYPNLWNPGGSNQESVWFYFHTYNILGDPALEVRAEVPRTLQVTHPAALPAGATHMPVNVLDEFGDPVAGAHVVLTSGGDSLLAQAVTREDGDADILFPQPVTAAEVEVTVSRPDVAPYMADLGATSDAGVLLDDFVMLEDASDPATDGDGFLNPGELALPRARFMAQGADFDDLEVTVSLPDGGGEVVTSREVLGTLAEGDTAGLSVPRIRLADTLEDGEPVTLLFTLRSGDEEETHGVNFAGVRAPRLRVENLSFDGDWLPGTTRELTITLANDNTVLAAGTVSGLLTTADPMVTLTDAQASWTGLGAGDSRQSDDPFVLSLDGDAYPGREVPLTLRLTTADGAVQTRELSLAADGVSVNVPTGPAGPGYYIYEDIDTDYDLAPTGVTFESIAATGTNVGLTDFGNNMDDVVTVDLPFDFPYWDDAYDEVSICSNGWFSFGATDMFFFRNRPLPGPLTPSAAVCVLWDDLVLRTFNSGIFTYYDPDEGVFTIEWYNVLHAEDYSQQHSMRFQAKLYDPVQYGAPGGLGMIDLVYDRIWNQDIEENYLTVGITSPDGREGLQYEFSNTNPVTAAGVGDGRVLRIAAGQSGSGSQPDLHLTPPVVEMNSAPGGSGQAMVHLANTGDRGLRYYVRLDGHASALGDEARITAISTSADLGAEGGPDEAGVRWYDSRSPFGPTFVFRDNATPGDEVDLPGEGVRVSGEIELPFAFPFYGAEYTSLWICEAGFVSFLHPPNTNLGTNTQLPRTYAPRAAIFPFWDDIGADSPASGVYFSATPDSALITWEQVQHRLFTQDGPYTFQLKLTPDGGAEVRYLDMNPALTSATVGVQNETGLTGLMVAYNLTAGDWIADSLALDIVPGVSWLTADREEGGLTGGETEELTLTASASGLEPGEYSARLMIASRLSGQRVTVPVRFFLPEYEVGFAPVIRGLPGESIEAGESFAPLHLDSYVEDLDDDPENLTWRVYGDDALVVSISPERVVTLTPTDDWSGSSTLTFRATDSRLNVTTATAAFSTGGLNDAPRFDSVTPQSVGWIMPGSEVEFGVTVSDPEGDDVTLEWWYRGELISSTGEATVVFPEERVDTVTVRADDGDRVAEHLFIAHVSTVDVGGEGPGAPPLPADFALESLHPNPFNARVSVNFALPRTADVELVVFNILGREVAREALRRVAPGRHSVSLDASRWASGLYFVRWSAGGVSMTRKAVLVK